jgi:hypothetical protein
MQGDPNTPDPNQSTPLVSEAILPATSAPPTTTPVPTTIKEPNAVPPKAHGIQIVWQLLTYSLWSWALTALIVLLVATLSYYMLHNEADYEFSIYAFAAVICLLPLAFFADKIYSRQEPEQKHGFAAVVMVLSAVFVFLTSLGGLITSVVTVFTLFVNPGDTETKQVIIASSLIVTTLGGMLFARILHSPKLRRLNRLFPLIAVGVTAIATVMAIAGPFRSEIAARNDKLLESNMQVVNDAVQDYARDNKRLPANLGDIKLDKSNQKDAKQLVAKNLVEYKVINASNPGLGEDLDYTYTELSTTASRRQTGTYELCATFKKAKGEEYSERDSGYDDYGSSYISAYYHPAGHHCYKLKAYFNN